MSAPLAVVKLGSSVLRDETHLFVAVDEIYAYVRRGWRVVAVTSAFAGETNRLDGRARAISLAPDAAAYAYLLGAGEAESASLLTLAADRGGLAATLLTPAELGLRTLGSALDSVPDELQERVILRALERGIVVVPGFLGIDDGGRPTLLGRGGSDLTAVFLADRLGADECRLVKNVDGWCDGSPASDLRFRTLHWDDAVTRPASVVQPKAAELARRTRRTIVVASPGSEGGTRIGSVRSEVEAMPGRPAPTDVVLLGLGTVGGGVFDHLLARPGEFRVRRVLVRRPERHRDVAIEPGLLTGSAADLPSDPDVLIAEAIGGIEPAGALVAAALKRGQSVVTANKDLLERRGPELRELAARHGACLADAAAVGGACPMLEAVRRHAADGPPIVGLRGILNGTCNWMLTRLAEGATWDEALRQAQEAGLAEADPSEDISGRDAARKLVLLAREAFGLRLRLDDVLIEGIEAHLAEPARTSAGTQRRGGALRLVASARREEGAGAGVAVRVEALKAGDPLLGVTGEWNALIIELADGRSVMVRGRGAGRWPTATAIVADLLALRAERRTAAGGSHGPTRTRAATVTEAIA